MCYDHSQQCYVIYLKVTKRIDPESSYHKKKNCSTIWGDGLTKATVVIIS